MAYQSIKDILVRVHNRELTPEAGTQLIVQLQHGGLTSEEPLAKDQGIEEESGLQIILFSAPSLGLLQQYAQVFLDFLETTCPEIRAVAHATRASKKQMNVRLAMGVTSMADLRQRLSSFVKGERDSDVWLVEITPEEEWLSGKEADAFLEAAYDHRSLAKLARCWCRGLNIDWQRVYGDQQFPFVKLPELVEPKPTEMQPLAAPKKQESSTTVLPKTQRDVKAIVHGLFRELLKLDVVDPDANFFELGGQSLLATRLNLKLRRATGAELAMDDVLRLATVNGLSQHICGRLGYADELQTSGSTLRTEGERIIPNMAEDVPMVLSTMQRSLWFIDALMGGSALYNIPTVLRLSGAIDVHALERSFLDLTARHDVLRTRFAVKSGQPYPVIADEAVVDFVVTRLSERPDESTLRELVKTETSRAFDLAQAPLMRTKLWCLPDGESILVMNMHHAISDGASMAIFCDELSQFYCAHRRGEHPTLAPIEVSYAAYAHWQQCLLEQPAHKEGIAFWEEHLGRTPPQLNLPTDFVRPTRINHEGALLSIDVDRTVASDFIRWCTSFGATPFKGILAAFHVLLARYSGQSSLIVATPYANRPLEEIQGTLGYFVNTLPIRLDVGGEDSAAFLGKVGELVDRCLAQGHVPFPEIVNHLGIERESNRNPVFQVLFSMLHMDDGFALDGLTTEPFDFDPGFAHFDLSLLAVQEGRDLKLTFQYSSELFLPETVEAMGQHLSHLLGEMVNNPGVGVMQLSMMDDAERNWFLAMAQDVMGDYPREQSVVDVFMAQARRRPEAVALMERDVCITYGELAQRAMACAQVLRDRGLIPGQGVGLCEGRTTSLVVGMLGILQAGGFYVPLDPAYPAERLETIIEETEIDLLLVGDGLMSNVPNRLTKLALADLPVKVGSVAFPPVSPLQPAYAMFTSGSTGRPKGILIPQRGVVRLACNNRHAETSEDDTWLFMASVSFDASTLEIYSALLNGAKLGLMSGNQLTELPACLAQYKVTILHLTAQLFHLVMDELPEMLESVKQVLTGGEAVSPDHTRRFMEMYPNTTLIHCYGPTENTTFTTVAHLRETGVQEGGCPLGQPVRQTRVYVTDRHLNLIPRRVSGEFVTGGDGLAYGYIHRPKLTAECFVPDPFSGEHGARLYRTGDLVRRLGQGDLMFMGRTDHQIKVRGYRIEPGEIAHRLTQHERVTDALVVPMDASDGSKALVGYVQIPDLDGEGREMNDSLRAYVGDHLPDYMVPTLIMALTAFPLNANGKVDRPKLPAPSFDQTSDTLPLKRDTEQRLAKIWRDLLNVSQVWADSSFFKLGGHSLLATRLVAAIEEVFALQLPLLEIFEAPRLDEMAARIAAYAGTEETMEPQMIDVHWRSEYVGELRAPTSFAQSRLWFLNRLQSGLTAYNIRANFHVKGKIDPEALQQALDLLVARHESLRTRFEEHQGLSVQCIKEEKIALQFTDLSEVDHKGDVVREAEVCINEPFQLNMGPLLRLHLLQQAPDEGLLLFCIHHIIADAWSVEILVRELLAFYDGVIEKSDPELPALPTQYADFARWQRGYLTGETLAGLTHWWRSKIGTHPPVLALPTDYPRPKQQSFSGALHRFELDVDSVRALKKLCAQRSMTPFMVLLTVYFVLLHRYSGQGEILIGVPMANRKRRDVQGVIGFFVDTLVLRADMNGRPNFLGLLQQIREMVMGAFAHSDFPLERLIDALSVTRDPSRNPLFTASFQLLEMADAGARSTYLALTPKPQDLDVAQFDLALAVTQSSQAMTASFNYATSLFKAETIARMGNHFQALLHGLLAQPDEAIGSVSFLAEGERVRLLRDFNQTTDPYQDDQCLHDHFTAWVRRTPDAVAMVCGHERFTFLELHNRVQAFAATLLEAGAKPEQPVAVCLPRDAHLVVALLAVMTVGSAYVPVDPVYPDERKAYILADSAAPIVVAEPSFDVPNGVIRLTPDADTPVLVPELPQVDVHQLAYIIYTSGSTGKPKGVAITHRNGVALLHWAQKYFEPEFAAVVAASTSVCFDLSVFELFVTLGRGARLVLLENILYLTMAPAAGEITLLNTVPSAMSELLKAGGIPTSVRIVNLAGEPFGASLIHDIYALGHVSSVFNLYGPSEDTTYSTEALMPRDLEGNATIGRPISNTTLYILDAEAQLVPEGLPGELVLGGDGITRGYHDRPGLTAERFTPDPYGSAGSRRYHTGDLGRYASDGKVIFLGRKDHQVKLRGFRIELGEIEALIARNSGVEKVVVCAKEDGIGEKRLVAYAQLKDGHVTAAVEQQLRDQITADLPEYMMPAAFMLGDDLPLTPNGKINRRALPAPKFQKAAFEAPASEHEQVLAQLWQELLGAEKVGRQDDFFALGGHSLLAVRLLAIITQRFDQTIPLADLFEHRRLYECAALLAQPSSSQALRIDPTRRAALEDPHVVPASFAQGRIWFIDQMQPENLVYNITAGLAIDALLNPVILQEALTHMVARHETLRTSFAALDQVCHQIIAPTGYLPLTYCDLRGIDDSTRDGALSSIAITQGGKPFHLEQGSLLRLHLCHLTGQCSQLWVCVHHMIADAWSLEVFWQELMQCYASLLLGEPPGLPPLKAQFADVVLWQREALDASSGDKHIQWWRDQLDGHLAPLNLPYDFPRPAEQDFSGGVVSFHLTEDQRLPQFCKAHGVTPYMALLAAFQVCLAQLSGQEHILVGTPVANRNQDEMAPLIGFLINTIVMHGDLSGDPDFATLVQRVRTHCLGAFGRSELPFERLVEVLQPERDLSRAPIFQVLFQVLHSAAATHKTFATHPVAPPQETIQAHFDLALILTERKGTYTGHIQYAATLFKQETITQWARLITQVLEVVLKHPTQPMSRLGLPTIKEGKFGVSEEPVTERVAPASSDSEEVRGLVEIWQALLPGAALDRDAHFFKLGGHSLLALGMVTHLNERFHTNLTVADVFRHPHLGDLANVIAGKTSSGSLVTLKAAETGVPWFIIHPVGGAVHHYLELARAMTSGPVYGLQHPQMVDPKRTDMRLSDLVSQYTTEIQAVQPTGPYLLAAWSMGGPVAFEIARYLEAANLPCKVVLIDSVRLMKQRYHGEERLQKCWSGFIGDLRQQGILEEDMKLALETTEASALGPEQALKVLTQQLGKDKVDPIGHLWHVYWDFFTSVAPYQPATSLNEPVILIRSGESRKRQRKPDFRWAGIAPNLNYVDMEGDHYNLLREPRVGALAKTLDEVAVPHSRPKIKQERWDRFDARQLITDVQAQLGTDIQPDAEALEGLNFLLEDYHRHGLKNKTGTGNFRQICAYHLSCHMAMKLYLERNPEVLEVPVEKPLMIGGMPRTGTTLLHRLLSLDPEGRPLLLWEARKPWPSPLPKGYTKDLRIQAAQRQLDLLHEKAPQLKRIHHMISDAADECDPLLANALQSPVLISGQKIPNYVAWLAGRDMSHAYAWHKRQLQILDRHFQKGHWVLKSPTHVSFLTSLRKVYPDANVVHTHRHPKYALPSLCSLTEVFREIHHVRESPRELGPQWSKLIASLMDTAIEARSVVTEGVLDVSYAEMMVDPIAQVKRIYEHFGYTYTPAFERRMHKYMKENQRHKFGKHRYTLAQYGLTEEIIERDFANYLEYFADFLKN